MELIFSVSPFRLAIVLLGLLLTQLCTPYPAVAEQDRPTLRLLILRPDTQPAEPTRANGIDDVSVPILATPAGRAVTTTFSGHAIDDALLTEIQARLREYYSSIGHPFVEISIPAQDVAAGILRVNIIETKLGQIKVEGNRWFSDRQYTGAIRTHPGDPIDTKSLTSDTNWLNRDPHRQATIALGPSGRPGAYDLTVRAKDRLPLDITLAADNTGTTDTGMYRLGIGVDWSNALWRGDDLSYGFLTSPDQLRLLEHVLTYRAYLPWRDFLTISGIVADTKGHQFDSSNGTSVNGHTAIVSLRYSMPLPPAGDFSHQIDFGYDFKSTDSNILSGGASVFPTTSELDQFVVAYGFRDADRLGATGLTMTLVGSPGNITPRNTQSALATQQVGATASYVYGRLSLDRLTNLPFDMVHSTRLTAQHSSDILLPSEQLVFGGIQSIRGFMELGATRDTGVIMQNELRLPPIEPNLGYGSGDSKTITPFVFLDFGVGRNHLNLDGVRRSWLEMMSVGPGLTWALTPNAMLRLNWGFPIIRNGHTGPMLGPQFGMQLTF
jgi:hemolysin activation/secretion protein